MELDPGSLQSISFLSYLLVFTGGIVTSIGPCNVAMIPLVIGFVGGSGKQTRPRSFALSLSFVTGLAITFMLLGIVASLVGGLIGGSSRLWYYLVAFVCLLIGLQMLGAVNLQLPTMVWRAARKGRAEGYPGCPGAGPGIRIGSLSMRHPGAGSHPHLCNGPRRRTGLRRYALIRLRTGKGRADPAGRHVHRRFEAYAASRTVVGQDGKSQWSHPAWGGTVFLMDRVKAQHNSAILFGKTLE
jgi:hypothetical protein